MITEMDSRKKPIEQVNSQGEVTKRYCDKSFKKHLSKALKNNFGEPDNIDKIRGNKHLVSYPNERIVEYVNSLSKDIQKHLEESITDPNAKEVLKLANLMSRISDQNMDEKKPQELPLVLKLKCETDVPDTTKTNNVNFNALNRFLYSSISGLPDCIDLNDESFTVLSDTYQMMMEQVEHDATPEFLEELKSKICAGYTEDSHPRVAEVAKIFQDKNLNPLNFPFEYLLNGTLPTNLESVPDESTSFAVKTSPTKRKQTAVNINVNDLVK